MASIFTPFYAYDTPKRLCYKFDAPIYDGYWYKVTEGNWTHSYGTDNYIQQPAPVKKTPGGQAIGLGSIWIDANMTLTVMFDSVNKIIYDNANGKSLPTP